MVKYVCHRIPAVHKLMLEKSGASPVALSWAADAVPDAATAEKIGAVALKAKLGDYTYERYMQTLTWAAMQNGDYWFAMPVLQPKPEPDLKELQGWTVQIDYPAVTEG